MSKPHKVEVTNELNGRTFEACFETKEQAALWVSKQIFKDSWGKPQRVINVTEDPLSEELEGRVISTTVVPASDEHEEHTLKEVKADYVIVQSNLNLSKTHRNAEKIENRKSEYPTLEEILHVILDHGLESVELTELQALRQSIKDKYPLE